MGLHTLNSWEIVLDAAQICLCVFILLFLILNRIKFKQLILKAPSLKQAHHFNTDFVLETVRQQTELAFKHIMETIDKERQTLNAYFDAPAKQIAPGLLKSVSVSPENQTSDATVTQIDAASAIYSEIKNLADQGMSLSDISERLNVPEGEVDLVLKLKRLRNESAKNKSHSPV